MLTYALWTTCGGFAGAIVGMVWTAYRLRTRTMSTAAGVVVALGGGGGGPRERP